MAVKGLDLFSQHFADFREFLVLIGGAACDLWFADQNMMFRATKDLDVVLIADRLTPEFIDRFWQFIGDDNGAVYDSYDLTIFSNLAAQLWQLPHNQITYTSKTTGSLRTMPLLPKPKSSIIVLRSKRRSNDEENRF